jgi:hypothetical protein
LNPKVLMVVLVLLVVLAIVGMGVGLTRQDDSPDEVDPGRGWVARLQSLVGGRQALVADDLSRTLPPACRDLIARRRLDMTAGSECLLFIDESSAPVRMLALRLESAAAAVVELRPNDEHALQVRQRFPAGDTLRLTVRERGGRLRLTCLAFTTCRFRAE